jgi:hypothetical protein
MNDSTSMSEREQATWIIHDGIGVMTKLSGPRKPWSLAGLWSFTSEEHDQLQAFQSLVKSYIQIVAPPRPLCLAVFGPPGSGKTHIVKAICKDLEKAQQGTKLQLPFTEVNLTELASTADLIRVIRAVRLAVDGHSVPVIFFDEFDAPLAGVPLGWLSRFLAPMQDGTLFDAGERFELRRAIYIFAGGTAARMADFGQAAGARFREAKGPDFVSRLRGYVDVRGPNDQDCTLLRRAVLIRSALEEVGQARDGDKTAVARRISPKMLDAMLDVGRFRHGSRSIKAIIEMAAATAAANEELDFKHLPPDHVLNVHRDLGELDPLSIGGLVGLSAGDLESKPKEGGASDAWKDVAIEIVNRLWKIGAVIGYGGKWNDTNRLMAEMETQLTKQAKSLVEAPSKLTRMANPSAEVRLEVFTREKPGADVHPKSGLMAVPVPAYWNSHSKDVNLRKAATTFRMRWMMSCRCVARVMIAGKISGYSGRMPGILEETMLALALGQPLYLIGGFGGGAQVVGELLGLASGWPTASRSVGCFGEMGSEDADMDRAVTQAPSLFRPAGFPGLPLTFAEAMSFVTGYSIGGPGWPSNGLTLDENRELFAATEKTRVVDLVLRGLTRRFHG